MSAGGDMSEIATLEAQLRANPLDEGAWLVYADALMDRGDVRGKLIMLEHRLARGGLPGRVERKIQREINELYDAHRRAWMEDWDGVWPDQLKWKYGFIHHVVFDGPGQVPTLAELIELPVGRYLHSIRLLGLSLECILESLPLLARSGIGSLAIEEPYAVTPGWVEQLLASPLLPSLQELEINGAALEDQDAELLACSPALASLQALALPNNRLGPQAAAVLASTGPSSLERLGLAGNALGPEGARALAGNRALRSLVDLDLSRNQLGPDGARALAASSALASLKRLSLAGNALTSRGASALAATSTLRSLVELDLATNGIGDPGAVALGRSEALRGLTWLGMRDNRFDVRGGTALEQSPVLKKGVVYW